MLFRRDSRADLTSPEQVKRGVHVNENARDPAGLNLGRVSNLLARNCFKFSDSFRWSVVSSDNMLGSHPLQRLVTGQEHVLG